MQGVFSPFSGFRYPQNNRSVALKITDGPDRYAGTLSVLLPPQSDSVCETTERDGNRTQGLSHPSRRRGQTKEQATSPV